MIDSITHHATLIVHENRKEATEALWKELSQKSIAHILHDHTVFDIGMARALISWANSPYEGEKIALISFHTITLPAQNALLKIVEEPRMGVRFIFITTNKNAIIPTLYSRLEEKTTQSDETASKHTALVFLKTQHTERMKLPSIVSLIAQVDEEGRKNREAIRIFILSLNEIILRHNEHHTFTLNILETASYASDPSSSGKALLEYLSLLLPQIKD